MLDEQEYYAQQEREWYRLQREEAKKHYRKKNTFDEALYLFEEACILRCITTYDDHLQPFKVYRHNYTLIEVIKSMRKKFPKEKRFSYTYLKSIWQDSMSYNTQSDWYHCREDRQWITGVNTPLMEKFFETVLLPYSEKVNKYENRAKPTFVLEAPKTPIIEPKKQETIVEPSKGKGRPKGSKNKKEILMKPPTHNVVETTIIQALQDIIWYQDGMKANEIMNYINADESIKKKIYAKLHEQNGKLWEKRVVGKLHNGANIERYYSITTRKGYFYEGEILSLIKLAEKVGMAKQTLSYRINKGINHIDAINNEINENMRRK